MYPLQLILLLLLIALQVIALTKVVVPAVYKEWDQIKPKWTSLEIQQQYNFSIFLYQKHNPNAPNYIRNRGTEAGVYLRYIVDHYYHFPDIAIFVHARPEDHQPKW